MQLYSIVNTKIVMGTLKYYGMIWEDVYDILGATSQIRAGEYM